MVCVVIVAMWAVSTVSFASYRTRRLLMEWRGGRFQVGWNTTGLELWYRQRLYQWRDFTLKPWWPETGRSMTPEFGFVATPFWVVLTLAAIPTAILWRRDRRTVKPGCCQTCGYDLRASKKTCPECGTPIAPEPR